MFTRTRGPSRSQELVFLDPDDDLGTIRSKLESSMAEEVYLVIPRRSSVLRTPLEFRILARIANELSSETILVTNDGNRRRLASDEGFRTRRSVRSLSHLMVGPDEKPPAFVIPDWVPIPSISGLLTWIAVVAVLSIVALVAIPSMNVTLVPQTAQVARTVDVRVDPSAKEANPASGKLPGEVLTQPVEVSGALPIPPDRPVGQDKARGEVQIVNRRPEAFTVPRGTQVQAEGGAKFALDQDLRLNPNATGRVAVTAVDPGAGGNLPAGTIRGFSTPGMDNLEVSNPRPMAGGTDRQAKIVLEDDRTRLREILEKQARDQGFVQLRARAGAERSLPEVSLKVQVDQMQFDQQAGTEAEQLTGKLTATVSATVFRNLAFNDLVGQVLVQSAGPDMHLRADPKIQPPVVQGMDGQVVKLQTQASGTAERALDPAAIEQTLRGKSPQDARRYLQSISGLARPPSVDVTPSWAPRIFRVNVSVGGES